VPSTGDAAAVPSPGRVPRAAAPGRDGVGLPAQPGAAAGLPPPSHPWGCGESSHFWTLPRSLLGWFLQPWLLKPRLNRPTKEMVPGAP